MGHADGHERAERRPLTRLAGYRNSPPGRPWWRRHILSVLGVLDLYFECVHLDVAKVYLICCNDNIHMVQVYVFKCFRCLRRMFQLFLLNVAKVDLDVAYTCMLQEYIFKCFRCFICMLQVFYLDVAYVLQWLQMCFPGVSDVCCKYFNYFGRMLQVFHLNIIKVDFGVTHVAVGTHM